MANNYGDSSQYSKTMEIVGSQLLEAAKRNPGDLALIQDLVENCPEATRDFKDHDKRTALHLLCSNQAPLPVVQYVASRNGNPRESCRQITTKGMFPLHYACRDQASTEVVQYLLSQEPEAAKFPSSSGWLPLHLASARQAHVDTIRLLLQVWPESVKESTPDGRLALHFACANQSSIQAISLLVQRYKHALPIQDQNEWTPLHIACAYSRSMETIQYLVREWKDGLLCQGKKGRLPLHVACWEGQPLHVIEFLFEENRRTLRMRDENGLLPLHAACQGVSNVGVVQFLLSKAPSTAYELGKTPKEIAIYIMSKGNVRGASPAPMELVSWVSNLLQKHDHNRQNVGEQSERRLRTPDRDQDYTQRNVPTTIASDAISVDSELGPQSEEFTIASQSEIEETRAKRRTSATSAKMENETWTAGQRLHRACEAPQSLRIIKELLQEFPSAIDYRTYGGLSPVHTACLNQASVEVLDCLCQSHPQCFQHTDDDGNLPLHLACFSAAPTASIQYIVRQLPSSLNIKNKQGEIPLDRARNPFLDNPDVATIKFLEQETLRWRDTKPRHPNNSSLRHSAPPTLAVAPSSELGSGVSPAPALVMPEPMGAEELRNQLNAIRSAKTTSRRGAQPVLKTQNSDPSKVMLSPSGRSRGRSLPIPQSPASQSVRRGSHYSLQSPSLRSRSPSPAPLGSGEKGDTPSSRNASLARAVLRGAARLFGGGRSSRNSSPAQTQGRSSRNASPAPAIRLPFVGGRSSRNNSPVRHKSSPIPAGQGLMSNISGFEHPLDINTMTLPPRPSGQSGHPTPLNRNMSSESFDGSISSSGSALRKRVPTRNSHRSRSPTPTYSPIQSTRGDRRTVPMPRENGARTFDRPLVVQAGELTDRATRPGVLSVNEPVALPDSAAYRAGYGSMRGSNTTETSQNESIANESGSLTGGSVGTFEAPSGVEEVRATLAAMRATKKDLKKEDSDIIDDTDNLKPPPSHQSQRFGRLKEPSSFYRAAVEDSRQFDDISPGDIGPEAGASGVASMPNKTSSFYRAAMEGTEMGGEDNTMHSRDFDDGPPAGLDYDDRKPSAIRTMPPSTPKETPKETLPASSPTAFADQERPPMSSFYRSALEGQVQSDTMKSFDRPDNRLSGPDDL